MLPFICTHYKFKVTRTWDFEVGRVCVAMHGRIQSNPNSWMPKKKKLLRFQRKNQSILKVKYSTPLQYSKHVLSIKDKIFNLISLFLFRFLNASAPLCYIWVRLQ